MQFTNETAGPLLQLKKKEKHTSLFKNKLLLALWNWILNKAHPAHDFMHNRWPTRRWPGGILGADIWTELGTGWSTCLHVP